MNADLRLNTLKVPQNDREDDALRKLCAFLGVQRAPYVRSLISRELSAHDRRRGSRTERPRHGHVARCPGRAAFAGTRPLRV